MADVKIFTGTTEEAKLYRHTGADSRHPPRTERTITVASILANRLDAGVLRDLVAALDKFQVPDRASVEGRRSDAGHLTQIVVRHVEEIVQSSIGAEDGT